VRFFIALDRRATALARIEETAAEREMARSNLWSSVDDATARALVPERIERR